MPERGHVWFRVKDALLDLARSQIAFHRSPKLVFCGPECARSGMGERLSLEDQYLRLADEGRPAFCCRDFRYS